MGGQELRAIVLGYDTIVLFCLFFFSYIFFFVNEWQIKVNRFILKYNK